MDPQYYYSGQHGRLYYGSDTTPAGSVRDWSFSSQMATLDATTLGDTYKVPVNGIRTVTGSCTVFWTSGSNPGNISSTAHSMVKDILKVRTGGTDNPGQANEARQAAKLELRIDDGYTGNSKQGRGIELQVKVTSVQMTMAHGEIFAANVQFESIGAPVEFSL